MGDPAGIGPEVALWALAARPAAAASGRCRTTALVGPAASRAGVILIGDARWLRKTACQVGLPWSWQVVRTPSTGTGAPIRQIWDLGHVPARVVPGRIQAAAARAALEALDGGIRLARSGVVRALVTGPVSKAAISRIRPRWIGHTEYLARACGVREPVMTFATERFFVSLVTTHQSLATAIRSVTPARVTRVVIETARALASRDTHRRPRVAVAALNPHAGEEGLLGHEETRWLRPLVRRLARQLPVELSGPWPADTLFPKMARGEYDAVVAMYHDQGLIPVKLLAWERAVNVTLGLPFIRTSPSHGTAFDVAGSGRADPRPMAAAVRFAITLASRHADRR